MKAAINYTTTSICPRADKGRHFQVRRGLPGPRQILPSSLQGWKHGTPKTWIFGNISARQRCIHSAILTKFSRFVTSFTTDSCFYFGQIRSRGFEVMKFYVGCVFA